jgi:metal-responsive CopG/Arc/MetJ family transcriptional regulator
MKARVGFTIDSEVMEEIDNLRGLAGRSAFINHLLKIGLKNYRAVEKKSKGKDTAPTEARMEAHADDR